MVVLYGFLLIFFVFLAAWNIVCVIFIPTSVFFDKGILKQSGVVNLISWTFHAFSLSLCIFYAIPNLWELI